MKKMKKVSYWSMYLTFLAIWTAQSVDAAAKAPPPPTCGPDGAPGLTTPRPVRKIVVRPIDKIVGFKLPNGNPIDFSADLQSILNTAATATPVFAPSDGSSNDPCNAHLELRSALTTFQMNVANVGITFGYTPTGPSSPITSIKGSVGVDIGTIAMDFSVWDCVAGNCTAIAAETATHLTAGVNLSMTMDFDSVTTGPSFVYTTPLGDIMRKIMVDAIGKLASSDRVNELPWQAKVMNYTPAVGTLIFDAGAQERLAANQTFMVYAPADTTSTGVCYPWNPVAYIHSIAADTVSSSALVDQVLDSAHGVQVGDIVMIRSVGQK